jgi:hypothetical protein
VCSFFATQPQDIHIRILQQTSFPYHRMNMLAEMCWLV